MTAKHDAAYDGDGGRRRAGTCRASRGDVRRGPERTCPCSRRFGHRGGHVAAARGRVMVTNRPAGERSVRFPRWASRSWRTPHAHGEAGAGLTVRHADGYDEMRKDRNLQGVISCYPDATPAATGPDLVPGRGLLPVVEGPAGPRSRRPSGPCPRGRVPGPVRWVVLDAGSLDDVDYSAGVSLAGPIDYLEARQIMLPPSPGDNGLLHTLEPLAGPQRHRAGTMGDPLEAGPERLRRDVRRPDAVSEERLTMKRRLHRSSDRPNHSDMRHLCGSLGSMVMRC